MRYSVDKSAATAVRSKVSLAECGQKVIEEKLREVEGSRKNPRGYMLIKEKKKF